MKKIAVVLSGCGVYDGSEIHEAVLTLLAIDSNGASYDCFAPDIKQLHVIDHVSGRIQEDQSRHVLEESARIARGAVSKLEEYSPANFDGLILPGGFGAAKNLSTFASDGAECGVEKSVEEALRSTWKAKKPIGALCISPVVVARTLKKGKVTIGSDKETAAAIEKMGAVHCNAGEDEIVVDEAEKIVTTPCYMLDSTISQVAAGIQKLVKKLIDLA